ncbi:MAG: dTMP kinase [Leptospira sp.]|nr:dTMP kinase [Leptospira sp.]
MQKMEKMAIFIVFEGIDGSGKSSTSISLQKIFEEKKIPSIVHQEPTRFQTGQRLRQFLSGNLNLTPQEELQLFIDDRKESVKLNIIPTLESGINVILDRYYFSTAAYQGNETRSPESILELNLKENFPVPDYLFYLDIDVEVALKRIQSNRNTLDRFETKEKLEKIRGNYRKILPNTTIYIDATQSQDKILKDILSHIPN